MELLERQSATASLPDALVEVLISAPLGSGGRGTQLDRAVLTAPGVSSRREAARHAP